MERAQPALCAVIRRQAVLDTFFPDQISPVYDLWLSYQIVRRGEAFYFHPERLTDYRWHSGSSTSVGSWTGAEDEIFRRIIAENASSPVVAEVRRYWGLQVGPGVEADGVPGNEEVVGREFRCRTRPAGGIASRRHRGRLQRSRLARATSGASGEADPIRRYGRFVSSDGYGNPDGIGFWALVREDLRIHDGDWTVPEPRPVRAPVRQLADGCAFPGARAPLSGLYRRMHRRVRNKYGIELDFSTRVGRRVHIQHQSAIVSGYCVIGDECIIRHSVTMGIRSLDDMTGARPSAAASTSALVP